MLLSVLYCIWYSHCWHEFIAPVLENVSFTTSGFRYCWGYCSCKSKNSVSVCLWVCVRAWVCLSDSKISFSRLIDSNWMVQSDDLHTCKLLNVLGAREFLHFHLFAPPIYSFSMWYQSLMWRFVLKKNHLLVFSLISLLNPYKENSHS